MDIKKTTICFCLKGDQVLLAMKKRGFGAGKWNGYGGKLESGESPKTGAVRELQEESGLIVQEEKLEQLAVILFKFEEVPLFECHVFSTREWMGDLAETEEMRPEWYQISKLPFGDMWAADTKWIPMVLSGEKIKAEVNYSSDGKVVKSFVSGPALFN